MHKNKKLNTSIVSKLIIVVLALFIYSCDCYQNVSGVVLDEKSKKPIDSVYVKKISREYGEYSNSLGEFELSYIDGGIFRCPPMKIVLKKEGYKTTTETIENSKHKIIYLVSKDKQ